MGEGVGHQHFTLVTIQQRGIGQFMGEGRRSPHFYPCHHLAQWAGPVHGGREQVTTIVPLSPFSTQVWVTSWGKEVGHHNFTLVTIQHTGLGQFMGEGSRSPYFLPGNHLGHRSGPVHGEKEQVTTILPLSPFSTQAWASSWGKGVGHHIFYLVTIQHTGLGQFMGKRSRSPKFYPSYQLPQRAGQVHGWREQVTTFLSLSSFSKGGLVSSWGKGVSHHIFTLVTIQHRGLGKFMGGGSRSPHFLGRFMGEGSRSPHFTLITTYNRGLGQIMGEGSRSPHFYPCHHLAQRARPVSGGTEQATTFLPCHHIGQRAWSVYGRREQVTTFLNLSPLSTQGLPSFWGREVGHHIFYLVTIQHRGLGQFIVEGSRSPHF